MEYERDTKKLVLGDRITVQTFRGVKGNIIGRMLDGLVVIFNRDSPYMSMLALDQSVDCSVNYVSERYVIVDPIREPKPIERVEPKEPDLSEKLRRLSEQGEWETAIFARALIHIIEMFDALKAKPQKRSSQKTDLMVEEQPIELFPDSDEFLQAAESFGLTKTAHTQTPKSELQRYVDEYQEEKRREAEAPISIRTEVFGTISDLPKDVRLLTVGQTRYLKASHLKELDGYEGVDRFTAFFVEASALKRREYGNVFYASTGTNSWHKLYKVAVERFKV